MKALSCCIALLSVASVAASGGGLRLVQAVKNKDAETVRSLLKQHVDVNTPEADGATALAWAAHWDDLATAELLIRAGAGVSAANDYGVTPLWEACNNGSAAMVEKLSKAGADPNAMLQGSGETALMTCARTGNADAVKTLLARGADVNAKEKQKGQTALMWALEERHPEAAQTLIEHGADVKAKSKGGFTPLLFAARQGDVASGRLLVEKGAEVNDAVPGGLTPLLVAADSGQEQFAIFLVEKGANVNVADREGLTALHYCVRKGYSLLLAVRPVGGYPFSLNYLLRPNMPQLAKALLDHGANPNAKATKATKLSPISAGDRPQMNLAGATPFMLAAATGDVGVMRSLLAKGADPSLTATDHTTPLMAAAGISRHVPRTKEEEKQCLEAVKFLVEEAGADLNAYSNDGLTALHVAAFTWADGIIEYLVSKGAKLDAEDKYGQTPLSVAEGDPNTLVDSSERGAHAAMMSSTAKLIRKLMGAPEPQGQDAALAPAN